MEAQIVVKEFPQGFSLASALLLTTSQGPVSNSYRRTHFNTAEVYYNLQGGKKKAHPYNSISLGLHKRPSLYSNQQRTVFPIGAGSTMPGVKTYIRMQLERKGWQHVFITFKKLSFEHKPAPEAARLQPHFSYF